jgi:Zn-dependent protease with chaperone function
MPLVSLVRRLATFLVILMALGVTAAAITALLGRSPEFGVAVFTAAAFGAAASWYLSADIATWSVNAKPIDRVPEWSARIDVGGLVERLSARFGLPAAPALFVFDNAAVNAVAIGPTARRTRLLIATGLLATATTEDAELILAQQLARVAGGDQPLVLFAQGVIDVFTMFPTRMLSLLLGVSMRTAEEETPSEGVERLVKASLEILLVPVPSLVARHLGRGVEQRADALAARVLGRERFADLLRRVAPPARIPELRETFTAPHAFNSKVWRRLRLLSHHNPLDRRAERLPA